MTFPLFYKNSKNSVRALLIHYLYEIITKLSLSTELGQGQWRRLARHSPPSSSLLNRRPSGSRPRGANTSLLASRFESATTPSPPVFQKVGSFLSSSSQSKSLYSKRVNDVNRFLGAGPRVEFSSLKLKKVSKFGDDPKAKEGKSIPITCEENGDSGVDSSAESNFKARQCMLIDRCKGVISKSRESSISKSSREESPKTPESLLKDPQSPPDTTFPKEIKIERVPAVGVQASNTLSRSVTIKTNTIPASISESQNADVRVSPLPTKKVKKVSDGTSIKKKKKKPKEEVPLPESVEIINNLNAKEAAERESKESSEKEVACITAEGIETAEGEKYLKLSSPEEVSKEATETSEKLKKDYQESSSEKVSKLAIESSEKVTKETIPEKVTKDVNLTSESKGIGQVNSKTPPPASNKPTIDVKTEKKTLPLKKSKTMVEGKIKSSVGLKPLDKKSLSPKPVESFLTKGPSADVTMKLDTTAADGSEATPVTNRSSSEQPHDLSPVVTEASCTSMETSLSSSTNTEPPPSSPLPLLSNLSSSTATSTTLSTSSRSSPAPLVLTPSSSGITGATPKTLQVELPPQYPGESPN